MYFKQSVRCERKCITDVIIARGLPQVIFLTKQHCYKKVATLLMAKILQCEVVIFKSNVTELFVTSSSKFNMTLPSQCKAYR